MRSLLFTLLFFSTSLFSQQKSSLVWKYELPEKVKTIHPIDNGRYLFVWSDEYAWLYESATGKKIWSVVIREYSEKAVHQLLDDSLYLVSDDDTLKCFSLFQNTLLWKKTYRNIDQGEFVGLKKLDSLLVLTFDETDLCISLINGAEVWRAQMSYEKALIDGGTQNAISIGRRSKYVAFLDDGSCVLVDGETGKRLLHLPKFEPNSDLIKHQRTWFYLPPNEKYIALVGEKEIAVIDVKENSLIARRPLSVDERYNVIVPTNSGCGFFGEEKFIHVNHTTGAVAEVSVDIDEVRNYALMQTDSGEVLLLSLENKIISINLDNGKILWQSGPKNPLLNGYLHRFVTTRSNNIVVTYVDPTDDVKIYFMSINALTGKINYRTLVAHADESLPKRSLPLPPASATDVFHPLSFGFEDIGFEYSFSVFESSVSFLIYTDADMIEPNTKKEGGEGIAVFDVETGKVIAKNYMKIAHGLSFAGGLTALAKPLYFDSTVILAGNKNVVALNSKTGTLNWMLIEDDLNDSYALDFSLVGGTLYIRTGGRKINYTYDQKKEKLQLKKVWEEDEYALLAIEPVSGKVRWKRDFDFNPWMIFPDYAVARYTVTDSLLLYGSEKFLYALSLNNNAQRWMFEFSDSGVGKLAYDDMYKPSSYWNGEYLMNNDSLHYYFDSNTTFLAKEIAGEKYLWGVSRILQVNYSPSTNSLVAVGDDGIAAINPTNGMRLWHYEWDYNDDAIYYRPMFIKDKLFYCINEKATLLNLKTGKVVWQTVLDKETGIFLMPDCSSVIFIYKDEISGAPIQ